MLFGFCFMSLLFVFLLLGFCFISKWVLSLFFFFWACVRVIEVFLQHTRGVHDDELVRRRDGVIVDLDGDCRTSGKGMRSKILCPSLPCSPGMPVKLNPPSLDTVHACGFSL